MAAVAQRKQRTEHKSKALRQNSTRRRKTVTAPFDLAAWEKRGRAVARSDKNLCETKDKVQWELGDWLLAGEHDPNGLKARLRKRAKEITGYTWGNLKNYMWVSGAIKSSRRRDTLSYSHHREVAKLDEKRQDKLLDDAVKKGWSIRDLRKAITAKKNKGVLPMPDKVPVIHVQLDKKKYATITKLAYYRASISETTTPAELLAEYAFAFLREHPEETRKIDTVEGWRDEDLRREDIPIVDKHSGEAETNEASTVEVL
jgi:hypothetical protein